MTVWEMKVYGIVQGVGFRPFVSRLADRMGVCGTVSNKGPYVEILAEAEEEALTAFRDEIQHHPPVRAVVLRIDTGITGDGRHYPDFRIVESAREKGDIFVSPDIATCDLCREELFDPANRRYLHPFINCTACGPRLTILEGMPYDRERTSMGEFPMCRACEEEYTHAESRRYDAQPVCCNECGPEVYIIDGKERGPEAITRTRRVLSEGGIAAIKGIGGFHLACDAGNGEAVRRLRSLKHRPVKPFAVMARDISAAKRECHLEKWQEEILTGHQKPILLLRRRDSGRMDENVAPGNPRIGLMLPYAPVQMLLFDYPDGIRMPDILVMTSGNPSGAPICRTDEDAREALAPICDVMLSHNRRIRLRADDSVADCLDGDLYMVRRSRGYAPLPVFLENDFKGQVLGIGGELKNSFCLASNQLFYVSPYIGDLTDLRTVQALRESLERMERLLEIQPAMAACDLHPLYHSAEVAESLGIPVLKVQHHYAHILSCMAENNENGPVIGVAFDGTGYGTDGTVWGGEFLMADYNGFQRIGSICPFLQTGGDRASREGWRIAVSMLYEILNDPDVVTQSCEELGIADAGEVKAQIFMADHQVNCILSTSGGRLFDAVSALLGIRRQSSFEGEASMYLQFAAERYLRQQGSAAAGSFPEWQPERGRDGRFLLPTRELFRSLWNRRIEGVPTEQLAYEYHRQLAGQILTGCEEAGRQTGIRKVALSGGVFQNTLLLKLMSQLLEQAGFHVLRHAAIPPNDGGIALGQAVAAMQALRNG